MEQATTAFAMPAYFNIELKIPVPWGYIAAKTWGDPCAKPVLVVHGLQDNAGSFDRLMPLLPRAFYYVCIDLPGHGLSSRFPKGITLDMMLYVSSIHRVVKHFKWDKFSYIGHSMGGRLGTYYAVMFPEKVVKLVALDTTVSYPVDPDYYLRIYSSMTKKVLRLEDKLFDKEPPNYTYEQALNRLIQNRPFNIKREAAEALLQRSLKKNEKGYYFSTDQRLKFMVMNPIPRSQLMFLLSRIKCHFLLILTEETEITVREGSYFTFNPSRKKVFYDGEMDRAALAVFRQNNNFQLKIVPGFHDVHNNEPEVIAPLVEKFLIHQYSAL